MKNILEKNKQINPERGKVVIAQNLKRIREHVDKDGNIIPFEEWVKNK